jgi:hypothetical protein
MDYSRVESRKIVVVFSEKCPFIDQLHGYVPGWEIPKIHPGSLAWVRSQKAVTRKGLPVKISDQAEAKQLG